MRILLTGATGFIGGHLAKALVKQHQVAAILRPRAKKERLSKSAPDVQQMIWDEQVSSLPDLLKTFQPDMVIHLAGVFFGDPKAENVDNLLDSNVRFPAVLLDAAVRTGCRQFINTGSIAQHHLNAEYRPSGLYGATKQAFADILTYYVQSGGLQRALTLEPSYVYGPNDPVKRLLQIFEQAAKNGEVLNMSPGKQFLDFVYVDDIVDAYLLALELLPKIPVYQQRTYALRSDKPIQLDELVSLYNQISSRPVKVNWGGRAYRSCEFMEPWSQGEILPNWQSKIDLADGLQRLLEAK